MTTYRARQVRALRVAIASGVVAALVLPIGAFAAWNQLLDSRSATTVATNLVTIPDTPAALVAALGEGGQLSHLFVATLDASGVGGTVVLLPIGAATETQSAESSGAVATTTEVARRLADVYAKDGLGALANEVQGLLDISFVGVGALSRVEMINMLAPLGGVDVLLDRAPPQSTARRRNWRAQARRRTRSIVSSTSCWRVDPTRKSRSVSLAIARCGTAS
ncbi:MAG: hypothetical protein RLZ40_1207 [Actinomycetota bacterium]